MSHPKFLLKNRLPADYAKVCVLAKEAALQIIERLQLIQFEPKSIVDVSCTIGHLAALLKTHFPKADLIAFDESEAMLEYAKAHQAMDIEWLSAAPEKLPIPDHSQDLVVA